MPVRHIETKIPRHEGYYQARYEKYKEKNVQLNKSQRRLRQKLQETQVSRDCWKGRYQALKSGKAVVRSGSFRYTHQVNLSDGIGRHVYGRHIVSLCISLYALGGCSLRGVIRVLLCLRLELGLKMSDIPSKSSVQNWLQKLGYYEYTHYGAATYEGDYGLILDECMVIGQQKMLVALGVAAEKMGETALSLGCVRLLHIGVKPSWNYQQVGEVLQKVTEKMGKSPAYVISDGCGNLKKGIREAQLVRMSDIGHEIGKFLEQTYSKDDSYNAFTKAAALVKFKEVMKETAYLLPPKQRAIARFMNMSATITWAMKLLKAFDHLSRQEQQTFEWLKGYQELLIELEQTFDLAHSIMKTIKNKGLSYKNIEACLTMIPPFRGCVKATILDKMEAYLKTEKDKLPNADTIWHASSDIIESLFGKYKSTSASNKLNGITPHVLSLCVLTHFHDDKELIEASVVTALDGISMADLKTWKQEYLIDNQVVRRRNLLKK